MTDSQQMAVAAMLKILKLRTSTTNTQEDKICF